MNARPSLILMGLTSLIASSNLSVCADEGMWLFNDAPRKLLKERHQFEITDEWLQHVDKSSARFHRRRSGSFVSEDGLVMSNHHVGSDTLQKVSDKDHDYLKN